ETRELADALKRRCLRIGIGYPEPDREREILAAAVPGVSDALVAQLVVALERLRSLPLHQPPGVAEAIDWAQALMVLGASELDDEVIRRTLPSLVKHGRDDAAVRAALASVTNTDDR
ncbi:MAG: MoxR family ATPase, partial [Actinomycetota bacterium]